MTSPVSHCAASGVWTARVAGRVAPAVYAGRGPMEMLSSRGGGRDGRRHWVVVGGAAPGQQDEEEYGGGGKEFMFHIVITF